MKTFDYNTTVEVDLDDILDDMSDEEVLEVFEHRLGKPLGTAVPWIEIYEKRRLLTEKEFLAYIDPIIQDATGRIL